MSEMVERVARAMEAKLADRARRKGARLNKVFVSTGFYDLEDLARDVIRAMREPTVEMVQSDSASDPDSHRGFLSEETLAHVWRCMINEALRETSEAKG